ncbi:hypothetical protein KCP73_01110 [Salmonella enterica subsp. enterica]|nr:hypothetical protein KCP73_01110 [Salmonella enterica subsp. enterica]
MISGRRRVRHYAIFVKWSLQCVYCKIYSSGHKTNMRRRGTANRAKARKVVAQGHIRLCLPGGVADFDSRSLNMICSGGKRTFWLAFAGGGNKALWRSSTISHTCSASDGRRWRGIGRVSAAQKVYCRGVTVCRE